MAQSALIVRGKVFARNVLINWLALVAEVAVAFLLTPFIVGSLGLPTYGTWSLLNSVIGYMGLVDLGIRGSVGKFLNAYLGQEKIAHAAEVVSTSLAFLALMSALAFGVSLVLAAHFQALFPRTPPELLDDVRIVLPLMVVGLWIAFYGSMFRTVLAAAERFDLINGVGLVGLVARAAGILYVLSHGGGLLSLVAVTLSTSLIVNVAQAHLARRAFPQAKFSFARVSRERFVEMWRFGMVSFASRSASTLAAQAAPVVAMTFLGPTAVGVYSVATQLTQNARRLVDQIAEAIFPSVMRVGGVGDKRALQLLFRGYARFSFLAAGLIYLGVFAFAPQFISLWVGPKFDAAVPVVKILVVADVVALLTSTGALTLFSLGRLKLSLAVSTLEAVGIVVFSILFAGPFDLGLSGLALASLVPMALARGIAYPVLAAREIGLSFLAYLAFVGWRATLVGVLALIGFRWISTTLAEGSWMSFFAGILTATFCYVLVAAPIFATRDELRSAFATLRRRSPMPASSGRDARSRVRHENPVYDVVYLPLGAAAFGGAERSLLDLACGMADRGRKVLVLAEDPLRETPFPDVARAHGIEVEWVEWNPRHSLLTNLRSSISAFRRISASVIHFNISWRRSMWIVPLCARLLSRAKLIGSMRAMPEPHGGTSRPRYFGLIPSVQLWRAPDLVSGYVWAHTLHATVSVNGKDFPGRLIAHYGFVARKLSVIYNGVAVPESVADPASRDTIRKSVGTSRGQFLACYVGRLSAEKGVHCLLAAVASLDEDIRLVVIGSGPAEAELRQLASRLGLESRVRFLGFQVEPYGFMAASDAVIVPSLWQEAFGRVVAEAMILGVPVIASNVGGMSELFIDAQQGLYVPPADVEKLANAILRLASDPLERQAMGARGKIYAEERYTLKRVIDQYQALYFEAGEPAETSSSKDLAQGAGEVKPGSVESY